MLNKIHKVLDRYFIIIIPGLLLPAIVIFFLSIFLYDFGIVAKNVLEVMAWISIIPYIGLAIIMILFCCSEFKECWKEIKKFWKA